MNMNVTVSRRLSYFIVTSFWVGGVSASILGMLEEIPIFSGIGVMLMLLGGVSGGLVNRAAAAHLRRTQAQASAVMEAAVDAIVVIDERGMIEKVNAAVVDLFGYSVPELMGVNVSVLMPTAQRAQHDGYLRRYLETGDRRIIGIGRETIAQHRDGHEFPVELAVGETRIAGFRRFIGFVRDISERKVHEEKLAEANRRLVAEQEKLIHAEKLSSIGLLASGIAHEVNNPLAGVMACIKALHTERYPKGRREEYFETARSGLERIEKIVRNLLDYARRGPMVMGVVSPADVVEGCLRLLAPVLQKKNVQVRNALTDTGSVQIVGDRSQMMQALMNVLMNATQASPYGSSIQVRLEERDTMLGVVVEDEGPGIPEEDLRRVRDPFFTTKPEGQGTGLGLAITSGIVEAHDGELEIGNTQNGARVVVWVPMANRPESAPGSFTNA